MNTQAARNVSVLLTAPETKVTVPKWIKGFSPRTANKVQIRELSSLPDVTVVHLRSLDKALGQKTFLSHLAGLLEKTPYQSQIVFVFESKPKGEGGLSRLFESFSRPGSLDIAPQAEDAPFRIHQALQKVKALRNQMLHASTQEDVLGEIKSVIEATRDLRSPSGRLSADRVAKVFGLSLAEIARLAGVSRQAISKTNDSPSIQRALRPFELVARLRSRLDQDDFARWLNMPSDQVEGQTPLDVIRGGRVEAIANWVENLLIGNPL